MAKPIKETPILTGNSARIFNEKMNKSLNVSVNKTERERIKTNFNVLNSLATF